MITTAIGWGGLGVQLNQFASGLSLAVNKGVCLNVLEIKIRSRKTSFTWNYKLGPYELSKKANLLGIDLVEYKGNHNKLSKRMNVDSWVDFSFQENFYELPDNTLLLGIRAGHKYHQGIFQYIKKLIKIDPINYPTDWAIWVEELSEKNLTGVHIRLGDYLNSPLHHNLNVEYFEKAFEAVTLSKGKQKFVVFSDQPDLAKQMLLELTAKFEIAFFQHSNPDKPHIDLELMTIPSNFIMSNSTFSWWAAILNQSENPMIVSPKNFFATGSVFEGRTEKENNLLWQNQVCPQGWTFI